MSTIKSVYLQHLNGANTNATMDTNGNFTVGGTVSGASSNMFRNRIINGDMRIDQRNSGGSVTGNNGNYTVDRFFCYATQTSKYTVQRNAGSVTPPAGFSNYLGVTSSSAYTVGSGDYFAVAQGIEGFNISDLAWGTSSAKTVTFSFWVRSSLTGTFGGSFSGGARFYAYTYTISSANTWEYKTVTIPGDSSGTWATDNSGGVYISFCIGAGSTYLGTPGSWGTTNYFGPTGQTSVVGTNGATFYITGVQLEVGTAATPFEFRPFGHELALCQRYYEIGGETGISVQWSGNATSGAAYYTTIPFKVTKRAAPTVTTTNANNFGFSSTPSTVYTTTLNDCRFTRTSNSSVNGGYFGDTWIAAIEL